MGWRSRKETVDRLLFIRPTLTLILFGMAFLLCKLSLSALRHEAERQADQVMLECVRERMNEEDGRQASSSPEGNAPVNRCPEVPAGWTETGTGLGGIGSAVRRIDGLLYDYPAHYRRIEPGGGFVLHLHFGPDGDIVIDRTGEMLK